MRDSHPEVPEREIVEAMEAAEEAMVDEGDDAATVAAPEPDMEVWSLVGEPEQENVGEPDQEQANDFDDGDDEVDDEGDVRRSVLVQDNVRIINSKAARARVALQTLYYLCHDKRDDICVDAHQKAYTYIHVSFALCRCIHALEDPAEVRHVQL